MKKKRRSQSYAAALIRPEDFVYLDAGTTTGYMLEHLEGSGATFVTNGVSHARALAQMGVRVLLIGGEAEGIYGSCDRKSGHADVEELSFYKGLFRNQWDDSREKALPRRNPMRHW